MATGQTTLASALSIIMQSMWGDGETPHFDDAMIGHDEPYFYEDAHYWARSLGGKPDVTRRGNKLDVETGENLWAFPDGSLAMILCQNGQGTGIAGLWHTRKDMRAEAVPYHAAINAAGGVDLA